MKTTSDSCHPPVGESSTGESISQAGGFTQESVKTISSQPGVYLMQDKKQVTLYVGKARNLRKRLTSYLRHLDESFTKTGVMLAKVVRVETIITATEKEALILEASLIKKHKPRYNIILRDDKNYPLIRVTVNEEWPRLMMSRRKAKDGARYFGPYASTSAMWKTIHYLNKNFPLRRCKGKELKTRQRPCLNFQMKRCLGPCMGKVDRQTYLKTVEQVLLILEGRNRELVRSLKQEMGEASESLEFERAALMRDRIKALEATMERQVIAAGHHRNLDVFGLVVREGKASLSVLQVVNGLVSGHRGWYLAEPIGEAQAIMAESVERFYGEERPVPAEILCSVLPDHEELLMEWLEEKRGHKVGFRVPQRGDGVRLVEMAEKNATHLLNEQREKQKSWSGLAAALAKTLKMAEPPQRVVCMDISNLGGKQSVGAVVSFFEGSKEKSCYRHYKIRSVQGPDDYASMAETLERHLRRAGEGDFLPDLLLVDGGRGQLSMAVGALQESGYDDRIELAGIAKEKEGEGEKLYRPNRKNPILLARHSPVLLFLMQVRDEAHRYGITFHRKWRAKEALASPLDTIPGVGPARKKALLTALGGVEKVRAAGVDEIAAVKGIGRELARVIKEALANDEGS